MFENAPVDFDLTCISCGYNLRGLPAGHLCPECGATVWETICWPDPVTLYDRMERLRRSAAAPIAERVGCSVDGVLFVCDAMVKAAERGGGGAGELRRLRADEVCRAFRDRAVEYFNDSREAVSLLLEWGVASSETVGRIIGEMASSGLIRADAADPPEAFAGLFDIRHLWDRSR